MYPTYSYPYPTYGVYSNGYRNSYGYTPVFYNGTHYRHPVMPRQGQFPAVDPKGLEESAEKFLELMQQAHLIIDKISGSRQFAYELMSAAQVSDQEKVEKMLKSTGVTIKMTTKYTPTGIQIILKNSEVAGGCCDLMIALRW